jgi:phosphoglycerol transferase MdoB-like AlkP superfamily enzyme
MIIAFIFSVHFIFSLVIFTKKWQEENISNAFLNVALIGILFAVGWSISGIIVKLIMDPEGLGIYFDRDTFSLILLSMGEYFFYRIYYREKPTADGTETQ